MAYAPTEKTEPHLTVPSRQEPLAHAASQLFVGRPGFAEQDLSAGQGLVFGNRYFYMAQVGQSSRAANLFLVNAPNRREAVMCVLSLAERTTASKALANMFPTLHSIAKMGDTPQPELGYVVIGKSKQRLLRGGYAGMLVAGSKQVMGPHDQALKKFLTDPRHDHTRGLALTEEFLEQMPVLSGSKIKVYAPMKFKA